MPRKSSQRELILDAAEAVVGKLGAAHVTLDAVAAHAGVSKGGLLYHFPSKEALLQGMVARLLAGFEAERAALAQGVPAGPAAGLKALILASFRAQAEPRHVCAALLAAAASGLELLGPIRELHRREFREFQRSFRQPWRAWMVHLALDGLWLNELLRAGPLSRRDLQRLEKEFLKLADELD